MFRGAAVQPLAVPPRNMPAGTLPVHGGEPPLTRTQADGVLHNPLAASAEYLEHGRRLFEIDCVPCHGTSGKGDGPVAAQMRLPVADLTGGQSEQRTDGYLYATIRNGGRDMPAYGDAMSPTERWILVLYVRHLQGSPETP
jgi:mono/diheme cytochrome c family protein